MNNVKANFFPAILLILVSAFFCQIAISQESDSSVFEILTGNWSGEYVYPNGVDKNNWIMDRRADGTYDLLKQEWRNNELMEEYMSHGIWWIENGMFYSRIDGFYHAPDIYRIEMVSKNEIAFVEQKNRYKTTEFIDGYSFTDYRVFM